MSIARDNRDNALAEKDKALNDLAEPQQVTQGLVYQWVLIVTGIGFRTIKSSRSPSFVQIHFMKAGWLPCIQELATLPDHPTWVAAKPTVVLLDSPKLFSPIFLLGFNKEEYVN